MTKAEGAYLARVAALGCRLCDRLGYLSAEGGPVEIHHPRNGQGMAQRAQHWLAIPLCPECHRGTTGIHGNRFRLKQAKVDEMDLLADTIKALNS
jgi:hypothetical protein